MGFDTKAQAYLIVPKEVVSVNLGKVGTEVGCGGKFLITIGLCV